jgi:hypothetical protein
MAKPERADQTPLVKFTLYLKPATRTALRVAALKQGIPATDLVERLVEEHLKRRQARRA